MQVPRPLTFVVTSNNRHVLESNFLASAALSGARQHQIIIQEGFASASKAYNDAIDKAENDAVIFVHQDVILPAEWTCDLERSLQYLDHVDPNWGVLGCWGASHGQFGIGYLYSTGLGLLGKPFEHPEPVETLDEVILVLRKSSRLRFDDALPHYHLYGTDICLRAEASGRRNYVMPAFCIHNTRQIFVLPPEFYECYRYIRRTWRGRLPIQTSCIRITRSSLSTHTRRLQEVYLKYIRHKAVGAPRSENVQRLIEDVSFIKNHVCTASPKV